MIDGGGTMEEICTELLNKWCEEYHIFNKCEKGFWTCVESYKSQEPDEFLEVFQNDDASISISLEKLAFCITPDKWGKPTIQIDYDIIFRESKIGWYREIYFLNGEFIDEHFVID